MITLSEFYTALMAIKDDHEWIMNPDGVPVARDVRTDNSGLMSLTLKSIGKDAADLSSEDRAALLFATYLKLTPTILTAGTELTNKQVIATRKRILEILGLEEMPDDELDD
jgi:hypothetical protein